MYSIHFNRLDKKYRFKYSGTIVDVGSLAEITWTALEYGLTQNELDMAFREMAKNKHTYADFGINGTFIFSK